jgi:hypothetical protein
LARILDLLGACDSSVPRFPPTELFNETWMLRLVLDAMHRHSGSVGHLALAPIGAWYSEARLRSPFMPRRQGDPLGEGFTQADAVLGHFAFQAGTTAGLMLAPDATQFVVVEAKMFSNFSSGVQRVRAWNQAWRNLACMAFVLQAAGRRPSDLASVGFHVLAPRPGLRGPGTNLEACLDPERIATEVRARVASYAAADAAKHAELEAWHDAWFRPLIERMTTTGGLGVIPWDDCIAAVATADVADGASLDAFYRRCLNFSPHAAGIRRPSVEVHAGRP